MDRSLRQGLIAFAASLVVACEGPPPPHAPVASSVPPTMFDVPDGGASTAPLRPYHTMTLAQCARAPADCARAHAVAGDGPAYLVAFGSGVGSTRTREQAMAELYRELRDRTASGSHLAAHPKHLDEPEGGAPPQDDSEARRGNPSDDPLVEAAFEMMAVVDREGAITVDTTPSNGSCKLALGPAEASDAGAGPGPERCFVTDESHHREFGGRGRH